MADELRRDRSLPKFAQAIALYHMVVEATLAQPGQHFIEDFFAKAGTMPGFSEGMANVSRDEQRHIGFGVKVLTELFDESDECKAAVRELLLEVMPYSLAVFVPPSGLNREYTRCYGFEMEDIFAFGMQLRPDQVAGDRLPDGGDARRLPGRPLARAGGDRRRARSGCSSRDVIGEPHPNPDYVARGPAPLLRRDRPLGRHDGGQRQAVHDPVDASTTPTPGTSSSPTAPPGPSREWLGAADVTWKTSWADWIALSKGTLDPARAVLSRRVRFRASPRKLHTFTQLFPRRRTKPLP